jgi:hypothetical protein
MKRGRGRRRWWFKAKGPRKINTIDLIPKMHVSDT